MIKIHFGLQSRFVFSWSCWCRALGFFSFWRTIPYDLCCLPRVYGRNKPKMLFFSIIKPEYAACFFFLSLDTCVWVLWVNSILYSPPPPPQGFQTSPFLLKNLFTLLLSVLQVLHFSSNSFISALTTVSWNLTWTDSSRYKGLTWSKSEKHYILFRREPSWHHIWELIGYILQITFCIDPPALYVHPPWSGQDLQYKVVVFSGGGRCSPKLSLRIAIRYVNCLRGTVYFSLGRRARKNKHTTEKLLWGQSLFFILNHSI